MHTETNATAQTEQDDLLSNDVGPYLGCPACGETDADNLLLDLDGNLDEVDCATCGHHYTLKF